MSTMSNTMPATSETERRMGEWKRGAAFTVLMKSCADSVRCPFCGAHVNERIGENWRFCPGCGAKMTN